MADIIGTDRGTYDVSTIEGCFHYLLRECHLPSHACAMVNKLYTMANIAEIGIQERQDWPKDLEDLVLNTRLHFREHMKWHTSHCPKSIPYAENETEPCDAEYKPYKVVPEDEGCPSCGATPAWTIECPGGIFAGQAWCGPEGKEHAEEWAETLNCAYEQGKKAGKRAPHPDHEEVRKAVNKVKRLVKTQCKSFRRHGLTEEIAEAEKELLRLMGVA